MERKIDFRFVREFVYETGDDSSRTPCIHAAAYNYRYIDIGMSMLGSPLPRKMLVTIGTLKNVGYLDRISNRMSLSLPLLFSPISFRIVPFPTLFLFHRHSFASSFVLTSLMWKTNSLIRTPFGKKKYPSCDCSCARCALRTNAFGFA